MSFYQDSIEPFVGFHSLSRCEDTALLEPRFLELVNQVVAKAGDEGITIAPFETYRSQERQALLYQRGATDLERVGVHHYGLACDLVKRIGDEWSWKGDWSFLESLTSEAGLVWGGHFRRRDFVHVQLVALRDEERLFSGAWYPNADYRAFG